MDDMYYHCAKCNKELEEGAPIYGVREGEYQLSHGRILCDNDADERLLCETCNPFILTLA